MADRTYTNARLRELLTANDDLPLRAFALIEDPVIRALGQTAMEAYNARYDAVRDISSVMNRPDVRPGSRDEWGSNSRLAMKVSWEGGLEAAMDYGINPDELHDPVVAEAWRKAYAADAAYNTAYEAAKAAVRASS